jgi:hypothetical protein
MLEDGVHGDQIILLTLAFMWDCRITVVNARQLNETRFRHNRDIEEAEIILVHNGKCGSYYSVGHYTPAGKYTCICKVYLASSSKIEFF